MRDSMIQDQIRAAAWGCPTGGDGDVDYESRVATWCNECGCWTPDAQPSITRTWVCPDCWDADKDADPDEDDGDEDGEDGDV